MRRPPDGDPNGVPLAPYAPPVYAVPGAPQYAGVLPPPAPSTRVLPTFLGLLNALKRRWVLASFLGLLAGLAAAAGVWIAMPTGKHLVQALIEASSTVNPLNREQFDQNFENYKQNQMTLIKTRTILNRVANRQQVAELGFIKANDDPAKWIEDQIQLKWTAPDILAVSMNGDNPDQLRVVLDALVKEYVDSSTSAQQSEWIKRKKYLEAVREDLRIKIENSADYILQQSKLGVSPSSDAGGALIARYQEQAGRYARDIDDLKKKIATLEFTLKQTEDALAKADKAPIPKEKFEAELAKNAGVRELAAAVERDQKAYDKEKGRVANEALLGTAKSRLDDLKAELARQVEQERSAVEKTIRSEDMAKLRTKSTDTALELAVSKNALSTNESLLLAIDDQTKKTAKAGAQTLRVYGDMKPAQEQFAAVEKQLLTLESEMMSGGRMTVREDAIIKMNFNIRNKMLFSAAVAAVAFLGVLVLVAYLEWRSRRVDSVDQVVNELGMRIIGTIPAFPSRASLKAGEADQNQNWRFILNESVNSTRTMLLHTAKTQQMQVIMVTSAMQGEGKTSLASQLATSMATAGLRTLILDCDLRNPSMHRLFDVALSPGCSEILCSEVDVADAVQPTTVPNLWMIPAGLCSNRVIAALAQGHPLEMLFNRLRGQFDFIVVDSCPILPVADSLLVGQHVDGAVISILQDISQLPKVLNAQERLSSLNIPLLGAVVNGVKTDVHAYGYNYVKQLPA